MTLIIGALKEATNQLHKDLEKVSYANEIMNKTISLRQYQDLIQKNHYLYQHLEPTLNKALLNSKDPSIQLFCSHRLVDLKSDLDLLKIDISNNILTETPCFTDTSIAASLGMLYVLEGARLGGSVIVKALKNNPNLQHLPNFNFYQQSSVHIGQRWKAFQELIQIHLKEEQETEVAKKNAIIVFEFFYKTHCQPLIIFNKS